VLTRNEFINGLLAASSASAARIHTPAIDFTFPGKIAVVAQRLTASAPAIAHNANLRFSSASVIKLLIAVAVTQKIARSDASWNAQLPLERAEIVGASESFGNAKPESHASYAALLSAMISQSDNTAANVLADDAGFGTIDALAANLGLTKTRLERHFMDFRARAAGRDNFTSASDMVRLTRFIASRPQKYDRILSAMLHQEDRDLIPAGIARRVAIANKTGELTDVRHDVAIVGEGSPSAYILAILTSGFSSMAIATERIRAVARQVDAVMA
jgi:beta-lactamase class A